MQTVRDVVFEIASQLNEQVNNAIQLEMGVEAPLFGENGALDSLGLVNLIVMVEEALDDEFEVVLTLADERAMSQTNSPFKTIGSLIDYINLLMEEMK